MENKRSEFLSKVSTRNAKDKQPVKPSNPHQDTQASSPPSLIPRDFVTHILQKSSVVQAEAKGQLAETLNNSVTGGQSQGMLPRKGLKQGMPQQLSLSTMIGSSSVSRNTEVHSTKMKSMSGVAYIRTQKRIDREFERLLLPSKQRGGSHLPAQASLELSLPSHKLPQIETHLKSLSPDCKQTPVRVKPYVNLAGPGDYNTAPGFGSVQKVTWRRNSPSFTFSSGRENNVRQFISKEYLTVSQLSANICQEFPWLREQ
ncbi:hypothetical protein FGO68_gene16505 [Halteria grandinella]|uniref:Uncharacterized protein n=1 Tax=Halteria grandinella TaxID=5974 RepID=A0A8J8NUE9_HALGN|nr:hypothetical protein FGO68_gene16505 [Halteria grandinella]